MGLNHLGALIGRERELGRLSALLERPGVRLITVTGPAGVGKTRVARAVAEAAAGRRVVWVELDSIADPRLVMDAILSAAGELDGERTLLVLDNFEHVVPAAGEVAALLAEWPRTSALVTSRHVLRLAGEHRLPLSPLALPAAGERDPARAARSPAVALFVARACAHDPEFALTGEVAPAVVEICRRLDGLPLAIELAAARVAVLPPPAMVARWESAFGLDARGACDLPARHSTLRRAFDWSYALLHGPQRALLRRLSAFPGGFDLDAVAAACRGDGGVLPALDVEPVTALTELMDRSLVRRDPAAPMREPRYAQLRTVREYLRRQLALHREEEAADLLMARAAAAPWAGGFFAPGRSRAQRDRLEREHNNLRAALGVLVRQAPAEAVELAADLLALWTTRAVGEGREWAELGLAVAGDEISAGTRARGLWTAALLALYQGDYAGQRRLAAASLAAARAGGGPLTWARALYAEALADPRGGARRRAVLELCERLGDRHGIAMACNDLGELARAAGRLGEACAHYERALACWRELDDCAGVARAAHNLARTLPAQGGGERAGALLLEALEAAGESGDRRLRATILAALSGAGPPDVTAATLHGAAGAELDAAGVVLDPLEEPPFRGAETALRAALGAERFAEAAGRGRASGSAEQARLAARVVRRTPARGPLTGREVEVVGLMADGLTNAEIAQRLVLSDHTVHRHVANILGKLGVRSRAAAASLAARRGLV